MTYLELMLTGISTAPHKRLEEGKHMLKPGERLVRGKNKNGLVTFKVARGQGCQTGSSATAS